MSQIKATFSGGVVAEPETKEVGGNSVLEFPVYVNHQRKDRDSGNYVDTGDVSKIRVSLWGDAASTDIRKGDIVEVEGTLVEKTFNKRDGSEGRQLQTQFVNSIVVRYRRDNAPQQAGFDATPAGAPASGFGAAGFGDDTPF